MVITMPVTAPQGHASQAAKGTSTSPATRLAQVPDAGLMRPMPPKVATIIATGAAGPSDGVDFMFTETGLNQAAQLLDRRLGIFSLSGDGQG